MKQPDPMSILSRRGFVAAALGAVPALEAARPKGVLVDTHIHLFEPERFPYHANATYRPPAEPLDKYLRFVAGSRIDHAVIVHPEPYQDDHRYLEYCFQNEPRPGFFKGTCLFDPVAAQTPRRMEALVKKHKDRIVALRIHVNREAGRPPTVTGAIRDRDLKAPAMKDTWRAAHEFGLAIQMHFIPVHAPGIGELAAAFPLTAVILDHIGRAGQGTPAQFEQVLALARLPRVYLKFSGVTYSSRQDYPHDDAQPLVRRAAEAFGANRILWGGLGMNLAEFDRRVALLDRMFAFLPEVDRARIRGENAVRLFGFRAL